MTTKPIAEATPAKPSARLTELPTPPKRPDAMKQRRHVLAADLALRTHYRHRNDVLVSGEGSLCSEPGEARRAPRPDCMVSFGLSIPPRLIEDLANGYVISEVGKPPEFVLEVASESAAIRAYTVKREIYAGYRVNEYWRFDYTGGRLHDAPLAGDRLVNDRYEPIPVVPGADGVLRGYSAELGLELHCQYNELRFWNPAAGEYLPDAVETLEILARSEAQRMDALTQRDEALERVRELEAKLHRLQSEN